MSLAMSRLKNLPSAGIRSSLEFFVCRRQKQAARKENHKDQRDVDRASPNAGADAALICRGRTAERGDARSSYRSAALRARVNTRIKELPLTPLGTCGTFPGTRGPQVPFVECPDGEENRDAHPQPERSARREST